MMKKNRIYYLLGMWVALIPLLTSCVAEFINPIPPPKDFKADPNLLGEWEMTEGQSMVRMYIYPRPSGWIDIICIETDSKNKIKLDVYEGYSTQIEQDRFLCLREREAHAYNQEDKEGQLGYFICHYKISENDLLSFSLFDVDKITAMVRKGELDGTIGSWGKVTVTSKANVLVALISKKGVDSFISPTDKEGTFTFSRPKK
jgi:hypothetical protein